MKCLTNPFAENATESDGGDLTVTGAGAGGRRGQRRPRLSQPRHAAHAGGFIIIPYKMLIFEYQRSCVYVLVMKTKIGGKRMESNQISKIYSSLNYMSSTNYFRRYMYIHIKREIISSIQVSDTVDWFNGFW